MSQQGTEPEIDLAHFTGSESFYKTIFRNIVYSEGVQYLAEEAKAYWLVDAIASHLATKPALTDHGILFWTLKVEDSSAVLTAVRDLGEPPLITQEIEYTDFPLESIGIWTGLNGLGGWTIYLPSEH